MTGFAALNPSYKPYKQTFAAIHNRGYLFFHCIFNAARNAVRSSGSSRRR
jgi:hypothetical protein